MMSQGYARVPVSEVKVRIEGGPGGTRILFIMLEVPLPQTWLDSWQDDFAAKVLAEEWDVCVDVDW